MVNRKAVWALVCSLLALAALGALVYLARRYDEVRVLDAVVAVPIALVLSFAGVLLNRRARAEHQRTLGRSGGPRLPGLHAPAGDDRLPPGRHRRARPGGLRGARARVRIAPEQAPRRPHQYNPGLVFEIGNSLREARLRQGLEIPRIEADTKIRGKYLRALEEEQFEVLPGDTYVKGFLRTYADYLGLDGQLYLDEYSSRFAAAEEVPFAQSSTAAAAAPAAADRVEPRRRRARGDRGRHRARRRRPLRPRLRLRRRHAAPGDDDRADDDRGGTGRDHDRRGRRGSDGGRPRARLVLTAARGDSFLQVRNGGVNGKLLWEGTLEQGQTQRFVKYRRLWIDLEEPQNLNVKLNGRRVADFPTEPAVVVVTTDGVRTISTGS